MASGIEETISALYEMVQDAWSLPLGADKCVLERDKVLDLLDEINNQLPGEFKQAKTIVDARNEVITNAKREAETVLKQAQQKALELTAQDVIYQKGQAEAAKLMEETKSQADAVVKSTQDKLSELKRVTNEYVVDALKRTEEAVAEALKEVNGAREKFESMTNPEAKKESPIIEDV
ncbi:MAG: hypothetical protein VB055_01465 [Oscillospiraceae bacterium]|nr:hypothetical protein [Oscillospiraceae bacterium]